LITLEQIKRTDNRILADMAAHYSKPRGFVGRNICYAIMCDGTYYGTIVGGSATLHLVGRDEFFGIETENKRAILRRIVNNIFFHIEKRGGCYPVRNMVQSVLRLFRNRIILDWKQRYGDTVLGFESLVELPRTGEAYKRDGWQEVGVTVGYTCKRISGKGRHRTDAWTGQRVWDVKHKRPKRVFVRYL
jgi:Druantia protein DruA